MKTKNKTKRKILLFNLNIQDRFELGGIIYEVRGFEMKQMLGRGKVAHLIAYDEDAKEEQYFTRDWFVKLIV